MVEEIIDESFEIMLEIVVTSASADIFFKDWIIQSVKIDLFDGFNLVLNVS